MNHKQNSEIKTVKAELVNTSNKVNSNEYNKIPFEMAYADWYNEKFTANSDKIFMNWLKVNNLELHDEIKPFIDQFTAKKITMKNCDNNIMVALNNKGLIGDSFQPIVKINFAKFKFSNEPQTLKQAISQLAKYKQTVLTANKAKGKK